MQSILKDVKGSQKITHANQMSKMSQSCSTLKEPCKRKDHLGDLDTYKQAQGYQRLTRKSMERVHIKFN